MPDAAARATDFTWKMVGLSTAYAALWGIDKGLEKISFDLIGVQPIMNWVAKDLKEAIMTAAVEQAVLHGMDYSENHLAAFLSRFKVPEHVTRSAMGAAHGFVEDVGVDTAAQVGVAAMAGLKAGAVGAVKGAGQGLVGGFVAGGPLGAVGGAIVGGLAQGMWEGGKEAVLFGASSPEAIDALNVSGVEWVLGEFATYMDVHREGAWRQLDDVIDKPLKARGISSDNFWGGDLVRRFMKGTIKFLIKHTIVEKYKKTDYESRRRAMQYRLAIYAFSKCSSVGGMVTDLWGSAVDKMGELSELFKRSHDDGLDWKTTLEYKYSFIGDDSNIENLKAILEGLEAEEDKIREQIAEHQGRIAGNKQNRQALAATIFEKYGENGSNIDESEKSKAKAYEKDQASLAELDKQLLEDQKKLEELVVELQKNKTKQQEKGQELQKAVDAYCGVSTEKLRGVRQEVAQHKLAIMEADHMIGVFKGYIDEQAALLRDLEKHEEALKAAKRELDAAQKEVQQNRKSKKAQETIARSKRKEAEIKARVDYLQKHIRDDFNIQGKGERGGIENVRKVVASLEQEIETLKNEKKVAQKALPKLEEKLAKEEAAFKEEIKLSVAKQVTQCTRLADDCVAESKNIIRLGMLVRDGYIDHETYEEAISMIRLELSGLPEKDPRKLAFEKVINDFSYENLFAVGHRNTSTEIEEDGKLTVHVFNTDIHGFGEETESEAKTSFEENLVKSFEAELVDTVAVQGFDTDENSNPVTLGVDSKFAQQVDAGNLFSLELSMKNDNPRVSGRLAVTDDFDFYGHPLDRNMTEVEETVEKLRVMAGGDELMVAKATQILNLETAEAVLLPLKQAVIKGRNETGFSTKMILKDEDNPQYIFKVGETPGQDALVITVTARWEVAGHETGDRTHDIHGKEPSTVEASTQFVIKQGDLVKEATGNMIEVDDSNAEQPGFFSRLFGAEASKKEIPEIIDVRQAPTCEFKSCTVIRTIYDDLVVEDLGLGDKHPKAPEKAEKKDAEPVVIIDEDEVVIAKGVNDGEPVFLVGEDEIVAQPQELNEQQKAAHIAEELQPSTQPVVDLKAVAMSTLEAALQPTHETGADSFYAEFGTLATTDAVEEIEGYEYLIDVHNAFIQGIVENELDINFGIEDSDVRLKGGALDNENVENVALAPVIEKLHVMTGGNIKAMQVAMQCLTPGAADALFTDTVKDAVANGRNLEGDPTYHFELIEDEQGFTIRTTATWDVANSTEKAKGAVELFVLPKTGKVAVDKKIEKQEESGGFFSGWFGSSEPQYETISVPKEVSVQPELKLTGFSAIL